MANNHGGPINGAKILEKSSYLGDGSGGFHGLLEFPPLDLVHARSHSTPARARLEIEEGESPFFPSPPRSSLSAPRLAPWRSRRNELIYILATPLLSALHLGAGERKHMCARSGGGRASVRAVCVCGCGSYPEGAAPKVQGLDARCRWRELKPKHARAGPYTRARKGSRTGALPFDFPPLGSASAPLNRQ